MPHHTCASTSASHLLHAADKGFQRSSMFPQKPEKSGRMHCWTAQDWCNICSLRHNIGKSMGLQLSQRLWWTFTGCANGKWASHPLWHLSIAPLAPCIWESYHPTGHLRTLRIQLLETAVLDQSHRGLKEQVEGLLPWSETQQIDTTSIIWSSHHFFNCHVQELTSNVPKSDDKSITFCWNFKACKSLHGAFARFSNGQPLTAICRQLKILLGRVPGSANRIIEVILSALYFFKRNTPPGP